MRALQLTPLASVHAVVLGQDPYHGPGQAEGLAFSVAEGVKHPPSLRNIFKELGATPQSGSLRDWARSGVLLLNASLTVEDGQPMSHAKKGWETLTDRLLALVAATASPCVYLLWGAHAQAKADLIRAHAAQYGRDILLLQTNHPSPLSASRPPVPFLGSGCFVAARDWLAQRGVEGVFQPADRGRSPKRRTAQQPRQPGAKAPPHRARRGRARMRQFQARVVEVVALDVDGGVAADRLEVMRQPFARRAAPGFEQALDHRRVRRAAARRGQRLERGTPRDAMHAHGLAPGVRQRPLGQQAIDEVDRPHLRQQARVEGQFAGAVPDLRRAAGRVLARERVDLHEQQVAGVAAADQRRQRRVGRVAAVPVRLPVDLHGLEQRGQAGRGQHRARVELPSREDHCLPAVHVGGADEHLEAGMASDGAEVDFLLEQVAQRIDVQRIALVGRDQPAPGIADHAGRRQLGRQAAPQHLHESLLHRTQAAERADAVPHLGELGPRAFARVLAARFGLAQPLARATALTAPALVPLRPSKPRRPSSRRASSTPQVKAPWEPPPCRARLSIRMAHGSKILAYARE